MHTTPGSAAGRAGILLQSISSTLAKLVLSAETAEQNQLQNAKALNEGKYNSEQEKFDKSASSMLRGIKHAAVPPPQVSGKAFLLEVREYLVYIPSQIDYSYLYCKLRQHVLNPYS